MKHLFFTFFVLLTFSLSAQPVLQGEIILTPQNIPNPQVIEPGTYVALSIEIENSGKDPSPEGEVYIRFAYANPISTRSNSEIFRTESQKIPAIAPGKKTLVNFQAQHKWPTIFDFIKQNWGMRQYQAQATVNGSEHTIGTAAIAFTMHYYPGPKHELAKEFPPL